MHTLQIVRFYSYFCIKRKGDVCTCLEDSAEDMVMAVMVTEATVVNIMDIIMGAAMVDMAATAVLVPHLSVDYSAG